MLRYYSLFLQLHFDVLVPDRMITVVSGSDKWSAPTPPTKRIKLSPLRAGAEVSDSEADDDVASLKPTEVGCNGVQICYNPFIVLPLLPSFMPFLNI